MINLDLLPLLVSRIAFEYTLYDKLRVASPTCMINKELLPLLVSRIALKYILHDKLKLFPLLVVSIMTFEYILYIN